jgi:hypothetical protein
MPLGARRLREHPAPGARRGRPWPRAACPSRPPTLAPTNRRQEADDRKRRAIHAALRRDFAAPTTAAGGDTNPLTRANRLTATNPLLGDSDDEFG